MTDMGIECFLAVCRHKSASRAAEVLYITQPSLSARLKTLERELGGDLFERRRGSREMTLTPAGRKFYKLAVQYEELVAQMRTVCFAKPNTLRISSINSLGTYLLPEVYELFLQRYPTNSLELQDLEFPTAMDSIARGDTDLSFNSGSTIDDRLTRLPVFAEPMVLIRRDDGTVPTAVGVDDLRLQHEVYIAWNSAFASWHQTTFGAHHPQISISIMAQLQPFLERSGYWAIVPLTVADGLSRTMPLQRVPTTFPLPVREISVYARKHPENSEAIDDLFGCLREILSRYPAITCLI